MALSALGLPDDIYIMGKGTAGGSGVLPCSLGDTHILPPNLWRNWTQCLMTNLILLEAILSVCQVEWKHPTTFLLETEWGIPKKTIISSPLDSLLIELTVTTIIVTVGFYWVAVTYYCTSSKVLCRCDLFWSKNHSMRINIIVPRLSEETEAWRSEETCPGLFRQPSLSNHAGLVPGTPST